MFRKQKIFSILLILFFGLTPLLWFSKDQIVLGHDSGLPLRPIGHFLDRFNVWTERYGFGLDQSFALPGFFIHGIEALVSWFGASTQIEQIVTFIFWLSLSGFSMYLLASKFEKELKLKYFAVAASLFYMINHFLLQSWYIAERTKYSVYAALPLILYFLFEWAEGKKSTLFTSIAIAFVIFFLNGGGAIPLFGGIILAGIVFVLFYFLSGFSFRKVLKLISLVLWTSLFCVLLNAYWLVPYGFHVLRNYSSEVTLFGGLSGIIGWLTSISQDASLINLLRLQGIPEWYQNPYQPYAPTFLGNPLFVLLGFLIPFCAFIPLLVYKTVRARKVILFFAFLALFSMIFVAGAHPPFGVLYVFLIKVVPGFIAFRTPFYKFAPALWLSYSVLLGFFVSYLFTRFEKKRIVTAAIGFSLIGLFVLYNYPFFTGSFFNYMVGRRTTRVTVPQYIYDYASWSEKPENKIGKTLVFPPTDTDSRMDVFEWGYLSNQPFTSIISNAPIINKNYYMPSSQLDMIDDLYSQIENNDPEWTTLAHLMGIQYLLVRNDFDWNNQEYKTKNPKIYTQVLEKNGIKPAKSFGEWVIYKVPEIQNNSNKKYLSYVVGTPENIGLFTKNPNLGKDEVFYIGGDDADSSEQLLAKSNRVYIVPTCVVCTLQKTFIRAEEHMPLLTRGSRVYEFKLKIDNKLQRNKAPDDILQHAYVTLESALAFQKVVDEKRDLTVITQTMIDYEETMKAFQSHIEEYFSGKELINEASLQEIKDILESERNILLEKSIDLHEAEFLKSLNDSYEVLTETQDFFLKNYWHSESEENKKFVISIPKNDTYTVMYKPSLSDQILESVKIDGKNLSLTVEASNSGWIKIGSYNMTKGTHGLEINEPVKNVYTGDQEVELTSTSKGNCFVSNKITGNEGDVFHVSFDHKTIQGNKKFSLMYLKNNKPSSLIDLQGEQIDAASFEERYESTKIVSKGEKHFYVGICFKPFRQSVTLDPSLVIKNISIRKITIPQVFLYSERTGQPTTLTYPKKQTQTQYSASVKSVPAIISLNQTYNPNWQLGTSANHFVLNGYANGWFVENANDNIILSYKPQTLVNKGFIISGISVVVLGGLAIFLYKNDKYKKEN